jgi:hypothetical protein
VSLLASLYLGPGFAEFYDCLVYMHVRHAQATNDSLDPTACTLLPRATSALLIAAPQYLAPAAPRTERRYSRQQDLERLMAQAIAMRRRG